MVRRHTRTCAALLLLLALPAVAQQPEQPATTTEATADQQGQQLLDEAAAAARDINIIRIVQALRLTSAQVQAMVQHMEAIQQAKAAIAAESGPMLKRTLDSVWDVLNAWMQLQAVNVADRTAVMRALDSWDRATGRDRQGIAAQILDVKRSVLTPEQQQVIQRLGAQEGPAGPGGDAQTVNRVVQAVQLAAQLDPQSFQQRLDANAQAIAGSIVGQGTPMQVQMTEGVKRLLLQLQPLTPEQWQQQADQVRQTIITGLGLSAPAPGQGNASAPAPEGDVIPEATFDVFLQDARALELLKQILTAAQTQTTPNDGTVDADPVPPPAGDH